jgi:threonine 3-dehydrogenase
MKALIKAKKEPGIWLEEIAKPAIGPNDVLIKINMTAICGTDIHIYNWDDWAQNHVPVPLVIGHEFVGTILEIGSEVHGIKLGDRVSGEGHIACGYCRNCRGGRAHICRKNISIGVTRQGAFAEYLSLPATNVYRIPNSIPDKVAAILDPFGNATHTALSFPLLGEDVMITGAGPVGIMAVAVAKHAGARFVAISDINSHRLALAQNMGATIAFNPQEISMRDVMQKLGMTEGFDVGLEMSGNAQAFNEMLSVMNHGGKVALLGFLTNETTIDWGNLIMRGITLKGIYGREMYDTWYKMIAMLQSGVDLTPIITHELSIDDYQEGFEIMRSGKSGKVVLRWH